jgi:dolichyl-phosphate beta-glucosyltransferase
MLHSRGELLLMLDADGATQVTDLAKLEAQVCHKQNQIAS